MPDTPIAHTVRLPQVILLGDSIRLGYQPIVAQRLRHVADTWGPDDNCETSTKIIEHLEEWVLRRQPDLIHLNCGLHDIKRLPGSAGCLTSLDQYRRNLVEIVTRIRAGTSARLVWCTTTPVDDVLHQAWKSFVRLNADVDAYNDVGRSVAMDMGLAVNDLHACAVEAGTSGIIKRDGVHFTAEGTEILAAEVARFIAGHLS